MAALRTLWAGLVGLYEETLILITGNLAAIALNLPVGLLLFLLGPLFVQAVPLVDIDGGAGLEAVFALVVWVVAALIPFLPTPGNVALAGLCRVAAGPDIPRLSTFRHCLGSHWRLALGCSVVSVVVTCMLAVNAVFYLRQGSDVLRLLSILWGYAMVFWFSMHIWLLPLMVHVAEPRLLDLYRRSAFLALGHFFYTFGLLVILLAIEAAAAAVLPVYALVGTAFVGIVQAHALREIRRRHGDLLADADEEIGRL